ncbi:MAG: hypothetical protein FJ148_25000 [Deltaproteobacteria bacterium]|nr:hypothetical protein [Deltaproteobacteria bacterium]
MHDAARFGFVGFAPGRGEPGVRDRLAPFADLAQKDLAQTIEHARSLDLDLRGPHAAGTGCGT